MPEISQDVTSRSINNKQSPKRDDSELLWVFRCRESKHEDTGSLGEMWRTSQRGDFFITCVLSDDLDDTCLDWTQWSVHLIQLQTKVILTN